jgi:arginine N-succinyltransferase
MILLREIQEKDLDALERFAQIPGFINLPNDQDQLKERIQRARRSFQGKLTDKQEGKYIFIAEDMVTKRVVGTSMVAAKHGTESSPHFYFKISKEQRFSQTINTGFIHGTLELKTDTNGPSEIGGLVIDPEIRNSDEKVGRQISFVRFLFAGLHPNLFEEQVIAELLPPLNKRGHSPLWEAVGRRFTNMEYWEADTLCQKNKDFIFDLFPSGKIYTTFLSAEARNALGKVGKETEPVVHMLEKIGFTYRDEVDPFDGGPHFWAKFSDIKPIQGIRRGSFAGVITPESAPQNVASHRGGGVPLGLVTSVLGSPSGQGGFRAAAAGALFNGDQVQLVHANPDELKSALELKAGQPLAWMPFY